MILITIEIATGVRIRQILVASKKCICYVTVHVHIAVLILSKQLSTVYLPDDNSPDPSMESTEFQQPSSSQDDFKFGSQTIHYVYVIIPALVITVTIVLVASLWIHARRKKMRRHRNGSHVTQHEYLTQSLHKQDQHSRLLERMQVIYNLFLCCFFYDKSVRLASFCVCELDINYSASG